MPSKARGSLWLMDDRVKVYGSPLHSVPVLRVVVREEKDGRDVHVKDIRTP